MSTPVRPRRTQTERTAETRRRLLEATVECLVETGYSRTTTQAVSERAGLSRGAQLHHFPTRESRVVAAVSYLAERRDDEIRTRLAAADGPREGLDVLADLFAGPLFLAALELWVAARTDPALRATLEPLERAMAEEVAVLARNALSLTGEQRELVELTLELVRGLGLTVLFSTPEQSARRRRRLLDRWAADLVRA